MLARALYKGCALLLLDEPTAALDAIAENEMYEKYNEMLTGKTALFISHRLASTRFCDHILFLESGKITEEGTHEELMQKNGGYAEMFLVQSRYYKEEGHSHMKKIWQEFKSFIKMISKGKKDVAVVMAAGGFMKASIPFLVFYFSAQILNNAIEGDYEACVKSVAALLLSQFVCELVNRFCQKRIEVLGESCQQIIRQQMADKAFELQYEKFENRKHLTH